MGASLVVEDHCGRYPFERFKRKNKSVGSAMENS